MRAPDQDLHPWRAIATIQAHAGIADVHRLIDRKPAGARFQRAVGAPPNLRRFNVMIDAGDGDGRYERAAPRMPHGAVDAGRISGFRVVEGNQWLTQRHEGAAQETETPDPLPEYELSIHSSVSSRAIRAVAAFSGRCIAEKRATAARSRR